jgi:hypothetical protein
MSQFTGISSVTGLGSIETAVIPAAVNWEDLTSFLTFSEGGGYDYTAAQITGIKGNIIITANWTVDGGANFGLDYRVMKSNVISASFRSLTSGAPISVANNEWLHFRYGYSTTGVTVTVRNASDSNTILDTFVCYHDSTPPKFSCLLTTTIVGYFGLSDNGPELTAMRVLRDHYAEVGGYTEIIQDYYTNSPRIIEAIVAANSESVEYSYIHNTVLAVKQHIDLGELQQAHDLYMAMYAQLKTKYLEN